MMNRIALLKESYAKIKKEKRQQQLLPLVETEVTKEFEPETTEDIAELLNITIDNVQHIGIGNRRIMPLYMF